MEKIILFLSTVFYSTMFGQPDTLYLTGHLAGVYTAKHAIVANDTMSAWAVTLQIGDCDTLDELIPGIAVLGDSCIRDDEFLSGGYSDVIQDSSDFHSEAFLNLCKSFNIAAIDDCGLDSFFVKSVEIIPPGGVDRPGMTTREFRILFRAVDWVGYTKEAEMVWIRDNSGCW